MAKGLNAGDGSLPTFHLNHLPTTLGKRVLFGEKWTGSKRSQTKEEDDDFQADSSSAGSGEDCCLETGLPVKVGGWVGVCVAGGRNVSWKPNTAEHRGREVSSKHNSQ